MNEQRQKMNGTMSEKNVTCKNFEIVKWPTFVNRTSKQLQKFSTADVLFTNTLQTLPHSKYCYVKHFLL